MKVISKNEAKEIKSGDSCVAIEYPLDQKDINGAMIKINGRYPEKGKVVNTLCKEIAYVIKGSGKIVTTTDQKEIKEGDLVFLDNNEPYYWEGSNLEMFVPCTPAWYPEQHEKRE